jgi:opacity protein-like surface antigen
MSKFLLAAIIIASFLTCAAGQATQAPSANTSFSPDEISGMYSFTRDGEFVQVSVDDQGKVTGFVSRFGDLDSDRGAFLDHFFKEGTLSGANLAFTTETVHGVWFDFKGTVVRGEGKNPGDEAYYVLKGTLTEYSTDQNKNSSSRSREVAFKSFPQDLAPAAQKKD